MAHAEYLTVRIQSTRVAQGTLAGTHGLLLGSELNGHEGLVRDALDKLLKESGDQDAEVMRLLDKPPCNGGG